MAHPTPYPDCIFCGRRANSREHAIPAWIGRRLGLRHEELRLILKGDAEPRRRQPIRFGSHRERVFCKECNTHFKHLEDEAADLITWMAQGRSVRLGTDEQDVLGRWGAKTGYALLAAAGEKFVSPVPFEDRKMLRKEALVSPRTSVGYGSWDGPIDRIVMVDLFKGRGDERPPRSYLVILTFKQLALRVIGVDELRPGRSFTLDTKNLKQVTPRVHSHVAWPMAPPLTRRHTQEIVDRVENATWEPWGA